MTLIVQDNTGSVPGANGYISEAFYTEYHEARGNTQPASPRCTIPQAIVQATEFIDLTWARRFPGSRLLLGQTTLWPRLGVVEDDRVTPIVGIPALLQRATAELALRARQAPLTADLLATATGEDRVKRVKEKVGPLEEETEYETGTARQVSSVPMVELLLAPLFARPRVSGGTAFR